MNQWFDEDVSWLLARKFLIALTLGNVCSLQLSLLTFYAIRCSAGLSLSLASAYMQTQIERGWNEMRWDEMRWGRGGPDPLPCQWPTCKRLIDKLIYVASSLIFYFWKRNKFCLKNQKGNEIFSMEWNGRNNTFWRGFLDFKKEEDINIHSANVTSEIYNIAIYFAAVWCDSQIKELQGTASNMQFQN